MKSFCKPSLTLLVIILLFLQNPTTAIPASGVLANFLFELHTFHALGTYLNSQGISYNSPQCPSPGLVCNPAGDRLVSLVLHNIPGLAGETFLHPSSVSDDSYYDDLLDPNGAYIELSFIALGDPLMIFRRGKLTLNITNANPNLLVVDLDLRSVARLGGVPADPFNLYVNNDPVLGTGSSLELWIPSNDGSSIPMENLEVKGLELRSTHFRFRGVVNSSTPLLIDLDLPSHVDHILAASSIPNPVTFRLKTVSTTTFNLDTVIGAAADTITHPRFKFEVYDSNGIQFGQGVSAFWGGIPPVDANDALLIHTFNNVAFKTFPVVGLRRVTIDRKPAVGLALPSSIFYENSTWIDISSSNMTGSPAFCNVGLDAHVDLSDNQLSGPLAPKINRCPAHIVIEDNQFTGSVEELFFHNDDTDCGPTTLYARRNQFSSFGSTTINSNCLNLQTIDLRDNQLSGSVPAQISSYQEVLLSGNLFSCGDLWRYRANGLPGLNDFQAMFDSKGCSRLYHEIVDANTANLAALPNPITHDNIPCNQSNFQSGFYMELDCDAEGHITAIRAEQLFFDFDYDTIHLEDRFLLELELKGGTGFEFDPSDFSVHVSPLKKLVLVNVGLSGTMPAIHELQNLVYLDLRDNALTNPPPFGPTFTDAGITTLYLAGNSFGALYADLDLNYFYSEVEINDYNSTAYGCPRGGLPLEGVCTDMIERDALCFQELLEWMGPEISENKTFSRAHLPFATNFNQGPDKFQISCVEVQPSDTTNKVCRVTEIFFYGGSFHTRSTTPPVCIQTSFLDLHTLEMSNVANLAIPYQWLLAPSLTNVVIIGALDDENVLTLEISVNITNAHLLFASTIPFWQHLHLEYLEFHVPGESRETAWITNPPSLASTESSLNYWIMHEIILNGCPIEELVYSRFPSPSSEVLGFLSVGTLYREQDILEDLAFPFQDSLGRTLKITVLSLVEANVIYFDPLYVTSGIYTLYMSDNPLPCPVVDYSSLPENDYSSYEGTCQCIPNAAEAYPFNAFSQPSNCSCGEGTALFNSPDYGLLCASVELPQYRYLFELIRSNLNYFENLLSPANRTIFKYNPCIVGEDPSLENIFQIKCFDEDLPFSDYFDKIVLEFPDGAQGINLPSLPSPLYSPPDVLILRRPVFETNLTRESFHNTMTAFELHRPSFTNPDDGLTFFHAWLNVGGVTFSDCSFVAVEKEVLGSTFYNEHLTFEDCSFPYPYQSVLSLLAGYQFPYLTRLGITTETPVGANIDSLILEAENDEIPFLSPFIVDEDSEISLLDKMINSTFPNLDHLDVRNSDLKALIKSLNNTIASLIGDPRRNTAGALLYIDGTNSMGLVCSPEPTVHIELSSESQTLCASCPLCQSKNMGQCTTGGCACIEGRTEPYEYQAGEYLCRIPVDDIPELVCLTQIANDPINRDCLELGSTGFTPSTLCGTTLSHFNIACSGRLFGQFQADYSIGFIIQPRFNNPNCATLNGTITNAPTLQGLECLAGETKRWSQVYFTIEDAANDPDKRTNLSNFDHRTLFESGTLQNLVIHDAWTYFPRPGFALKECSFENTGFIDLGADQRLPSGGSLELDPYPFIVGPNLLFLGLTKTSLKRWDSPIKIIPPLSHTPVEIFVYENADLVTPPNWYDFLTVPNETEILSYYLTHGLENTPVVTSILDLVPIMIDNLNLEYNQLKGKAVDLFHYWYAPSITPGYSSETNSFYTSVSLNHTIRYFSVLGNPLHCHGWENILVPTSFSELIPYPEPTVDGFGLLCGVCEVPEQSLLSPLPNLSQCGCVNPDWYNLQTGVCSNIHPEDSALVDVLFSLIEFRNPGSTFNWTEVKAQGTECTAATNVGDSVVTCLVVNNSNRVSAIYLSNVDLITNQSIPTHLFASFSQLKYLSLDSWSATTQEEFPCITEFANQTDSFFRSFQIQNFLIRSLTGELAPANLTFRCCHLPHSNLNAYSTNVEYSHTFSSIDNNLPCSIGVRDLTLAYFPSEPVTLRFTDTSFVRSVYLYNDDPFVSIELSDIQKMFLNRWELRNFSLAIEFGFLASFDVQSTSYFTKDLLLLEEQNDRPTIQFPPPSSICPPLNYSHFGGNYEEHYDYCISNNPCLDPSIRNRCVFGSCEIYTGNCTCLPCYQGDRCDIYNASLCLTCSEVQRTACNPTYPTSSSCSLNRLNQTQALCSEDSDLCSGNGIFDKTMCRCRSGFTGNRCENPLLSLSTDNPSCAIETPVNQSELGEPFSLASLPIISGGLLTLEFRTSHAAKRVVEQIILGTGCVIPNSQPEINRFLVQEFDVPTCSNRYFLKIPIARLSSSCGISPTVSGSNTIYQSSLLLSILDEIDLTTIPIKKRDPGTGYTSSSSFFFFTLILPTTLQITVGGVSYTAPISMTAFISRRVYLVGSDTMEIFIDTFITHPYYLHQESTPSLGPVNPLNTQLDLVTLTCPSDGSAICSQRTRLNLTQLSAGGCEVDGHYTVRWEITCHPDAITAGLCAELGQIAELNFTISGADGCNIVTSEDIFNITSEAFALENGAGSLRVEKDQSMQLRVNVTSNYNVTGLTLEELYVIVRGSSGALYTRLLYRASPAFLLSSSLQLVLPPQSGSSSLTTFKFTSSGASTDVFNQQILDDRVGGVIPFNITALYTINYNLGESLTIGSGGFGRKRSVEIEVGTQMKISPRFLNQDTNVDFPPLQFISPRNGTDDDDDDDQGGGGGDDDDVLDETQDLILGLILAGAAMLIVMVCFCILCGYKNRQRSQKDGFIRM